MQIRSQTVAELKQNEIELVHSDLKASANTIQDFVSWKGKYVNKWRSRGFTYDWVQERDGSDHIENVYEYFNDPEKPERTKKAPDYEAASWYFAPEDPGNLRDDSYLPEFQDDIIRYA